MKEESKSYIYMIRCEDLSIYTGITKDVKRRMEEHKARGKEGAKYMKSHPFLRLEVVFETDSWSKAARLESAIKRLSKYEKEELIRNPRRVGEMFGDKFSDCDFLPVVVE